MNQQYRSLLGFFLILFLSVAIFSLVYKDTLPKILEEINNSMLGAIITAMITFSLLDKQAELENRLNKETIQKQAEIEDHRVRDAKIFEEKLASYKEFLHSLETIISDKSISTAFEKKSGPDEFEKLVFNMAIVKMHTQSNRVISIFKSVSEIISFVNELDETDDAALGKYYTDLSNRLFQIVGEFQKELYGDNASLIGNIEGLNVANLFKETETIIGVVGEKRRGEKFITQLFQSGKIKVGDALYYSPVLASLNINERGKAKVIIGRNHSNCLQVEGDESYYSFSYMRRKFIKDFNLNLNPNFTFSQRNEWVDENGKTISELLKC